ncbi:MAG: YbhB/YbcL family Raf kinase inhibitor-like protein [Actinomycetota bacterium]
MTAPLTLTSRAFPDGAGIPRRHTCEGDDLSPPLAWDGIPAGTRSLALTVDDPDAPGGVFVHWLAWGIPPTAAGVAEGERAPVEGRNGFGTTGYRGPCPPRGHGPHRYVFSLHALDADLALPAGAGVDEVRRAIAGHELAAARLVGVYERPRR